jgi:hypothetical protein
MDTTTQYQNTPGFKFFISQFHLNKKQDGMQQKKNRNFDLKDWISISIDVYFTLSSNGECVGGVVHQLIR